MNKRIFAVVAVLALATSLSACTINVAAPGSGSGGAGVSKSEDVAGDLKKYATQVTPLVSVENDLLSRYAAVTGENFVDDGTLYDALQGLVPDVNAYVGQLEAIHPQTATLQAIHAKYVDAWNKYGQAFQVSMAALENQDPAQLADANKLLAQARALVIEWQNDIKALG